MATVSMATVSMVTASPAAASRATASRATASAAITDFMVTTHSMAAASSFSDLVVAGVRGGGATPPTTILRLAYLLSANLLRSTGEL